MNTKTQEIITSSPIKNVWNANVLAGLPSAISESGLNINLDPSFYDWLKGKRTGFDQYRFSRNFSMGGRNGELIKAGTSEFKSRFNPHYSKLKYFTVAAGFVLLLLSFIFLLIVASVLLNPSH